MNTRRRHSVATSDADVRDPGIRQPFRTANLLVGLYAGLSVLTLIAVVLLRDHADLVTDAVWIRVTIVAATSLLMASFAAGTARGHGRSYLRLRLTSGIMLVAIAVVIALPGAFPMWLKIEQGVCGALLIGVVVIVNSRQTRSATRRMVGQEPSAST